MGSPLTSEEQFRTRSGTPMIGPYSVNQMDDFYSALYTGHAKPSGVMNYLQHQYIADRCAEGAHVADVCCGRGLQLPVLYKAAPHIASYTGLDISTGNLAEARDTVDRLDAHYGRRPFPVAWHETDVSEPWPAGLPKFDVMVNTSAFEHLPKPQGIHCIHHMAQALADDGMLYLSTPESPGPPPRPLQYRVHVYEWNRDELEPVLNAAGLEVIDAIGLLPGSDTEITAALEEWYGQGAARWYERLQATVPAPFLHTVAAAAVPGAASEILYVCRRRS